VRSSVATAPSTRSRPQPAPTRPARQPPEEQGLRRDRRLERKAGAAGEEDQGDLRAARREGEENIVVLGDLNDTPPSAPLEPLLAQTDLKDISTHPAFTDDGRPGTFRNGTKSQKIDYVLLSPALFDRVLGGAVFRTGVWGGKNGTLWPLASHGSTSPRRRLFPPYHGRGRRARDEACTLGRPRSRRAAHGLGDARAVLSVALSSREPRARASPRQGWAGSR
jgi:hypothetical protein